MKKFIFVTIIAVLSSLSVNLSAEEDASVKVYGHTGCPWTVKTLKYLDKENINYNLLDVKNDVAANRDFYDRGYKKIPQVIVGDQDEVSGWRKGTLKKLLIKHELLSE